jgi:transposase
MRLQKNGLKPKAIIGALMRKLVHIIFGIIKHQQPFNPKLV